MLLEVLVIVLGVVLFLGDGRENEGNVVFVRWIIIGEVFSKIKDVGEFFSIIKDGM